MALTRRSLLACAALGALLAGSAPLAADEPLEVVASFSILGDMVSVVGGERVHVETLVGAGQDAHVFDPAPTDARMLGAADLVVVNGLGFEGWMDRLVAASGYAGDIVVASIGVDPLPGEDEDGHDEDEAHADDQDEGHHHGAFDPHAWQDLANGEIYARNIAAGLSAADPAGAATYAANAAAYIDAMRALDADIRATTDALPDGARTIVTSHDAFGYFAHAYGIVFLAPEGISTDDEPSAAEVAALIDQIRSEHIAAVFVENIAYNRILERIAEDTGVVIGGTLFSDSLSGPQGPAATYLAMMRHNAGELVAALRAF